MSISCKRAMKLLSQAQDRELDEREKQALDEHLARCFLCERGKSQLDVIHELMKRFAND